MIGFFNGTVWEYRPRVLLSLEEKERFLAEWRAMGLNIVELPALSPACRAEHRRAGQREPFFQDVSMRALQLRGIVHNELPKDVRDLCECGACLTPCFSYCTGCWEHFCCRLHWHQHMCTGTLPDFLGRHQADGTVREYIPCHFGPDAVLSVCKDPPDLPEELGPWRAGMLEFGTL